MAAWESVDYYDSVVEGDNPYCYFACHENSGGIIYDSIYQRSGTLVGNSWIVANTAAPLMGGNSIYFDGSSGYVAIQDGIFPTGTTKWSVEFWVMVNNDQNVGYNRFVSNNIAETTLVGFEIGCRQNLQYIFSTLGQTTTHVVVNATEPTPYLGQWMHIVYLYDGTNYVGYINGVQKTSVAVTTPVVNSGQPIYLGCTEAVGPYNFFQGFMTKVAFYTTNLTPTQITNHYNAMGPTSSRSHFLNFYPSDQVSGIIATADTLSRIPENAYTTYSYSVGTATGYAELVRQPGAGAWAALGAIGTPSGKGFVLDGVYLQNAAISTNGNWLFTLPFQLSAGSITANIYVRFYTYTNSTYTAIYSTVYNNVKIDNILTAYSFYSANSGSAFFLYAGQYFYMDIWLDITTNASSAGSTLSFLVGSGSNGYKNCVVAAPYWNPTWYNPYYYFPTNVASTHLPTANQLSVSTAGGAVTVTNIMLVGVATGASEIIAQGSGAAWAALAWAVQNWNNPSPVPAPTGKGWLCDSNVLTNNTLIPNTWTFNMYLSINTTGTITADYYARFYKYTMTNTQNSAVTLNNEGISPDSSPGSANFDTYGYSYSNNALTNIGFIPGTQVYANGFVFNWPSVTIGQHDNLQASGQVIPITSIGTLAFLGSATNGPSSGTATITYTDLTTQTFSLSFSDWTLNAGSATVEAGNTIAATMPYRNGSGGQQLVPTHIFFTSVALTPGKTTQSVTLPSTVSTGFIHVFAVSGLYTPGTYTFIAESIITGIAVTNAAATKTVASLNLPQSLQFKGNDFLYIDLWADITANTGTSTTQLQYALYNSATSGGTLTDLVTSGYAVYWGFPTMVDASATTSESYTDIASTALINTGTLAGESILNQLLLTQPTYTFYGLSFGSVIDYDYAEYWSAGSNFPAVRPSGNRYTSIIPANNAAIVTGQQFNNNGYHYTFATGGSGEIALEGLENVLNGDMVITFLLPIAQGTPHLNFLLQIAPGLTFVDTGTGILDLKSGSTTLMTVPYYRGWSPSGVAGNIVYLLRFQWQSTNGAQMLINAAASIGINPALPTLTGSGYTVPAFNPYPILQMDQNTLSFEDVVLSHNPQVYYQLLESTTPYYDVITGIGSGTLAGNTNPYWGDIIPGRAGSSLNFPTQSTSAYLDLGTTNPNLSPSAQITLEIVMNINAYATSGYNSIVGWQGTVGSYNLRTFSLYFYNGGYIHISFTNATGTTFEFGTSNPIGHGTHLIHATYDGNTVAIYVDGVNTNTWTTGSAGYYQHPIEILGAFDNSAPTFQGSIGHYALYNYVFTQAQVTAVHSAFGSGNRYNAYRYGGSPLQTIAGSAVIQYYYPVLQVNVPVTAAVQYPAAINPTYTTKQQVAKVYTAAGQFIDVWRDCPLFGEDGGATPVITINTVSAQIQVRLPRKFDQFDEVGTPNSRGTVGAGNIVQFWIVDNGQLTNGKMIWQGRIDTYVPQIDDQGNEYVTVTLTPWDAILGDVNFTGTQNFGTAGNAATYVDPVTMFNWVFTNTNPATGNVYTYPLTTDPGNPTTSGVTYQLQLHNQSLSSWFESVRKVAPYNWYWYMKQSTKTVVFEAAGTTATHTFLIGKHIGQPQYAKDITNLKNYIVVKGYGTIQATAQGTDIGTYGQRTWVIVEPRIVDQNTAQQYANSTLNALDRVDYRSVIRVYDNRGDPTGLGYDIETINLGEMVRILNPLAPEYPTLWDEATWDSSYWDFANIEALNNVVQITSITYGFDYVDLQISNVQPSQDRFLVNLQLQFNEFTAN